MMGKGALSSPAGFDLGVLERVMLLRGVSGAKKAKIGKSKKIRAAAVSDAYWAPTQVTMSRRA